MRGDRFRPLQWLGVAIALAGLAWLLMPGIPVLFKPINAAESIRIAICAPSAVPKTVSHIPPPPLREFS